MSGLFTNWQNVNQSMCFDTSAPKGSEKVAFCNLTLFFSCFCILINLREYSLIEPQNKGKYFTQVEHFSTHANSSLPQLAPHSTNLKTVLKLSVKEIDLGNGIFK